MSEGELATPMRPWRKVLATAVVGVIVLGHAYDGLRNTTHWPFHPFHMFAALSHSRGYIVRRIVGVDGDGREVALAAPAYSDPILIYHVRLQFGRAYDLKKNRCATLAAMAADYLARYERHRLDGRHSGPKLVGLRLYEISWHSMDRQAQNADRPDARILLFDSTIPCDDRVRQPPASAGAEMMGEQP